MRGSGSLSSGLPDFPWDLLEGAKARAAAHPDGIVDLSIGTPVDPVPSVIQDALAAAANAPGYPLTAGSPALRAAITHWAGRSCLRADDGSGHMGAGHGFGVLPTIGSKELVAWLPTLLGLGAGDTVVIPSVCYPTYEVGARLAGATVVRSDRPDLLPPDGIGLVWINSPGNPTGAVLRDETMRGIIDVGPHARHRRRERRVLPVAGLGGRADVGAERLRRRFHRCAGRALAVEAFESRRLPGRVRRR